MGDALLENNRRADRKEREKQARIDACRSVQIETNARPLKKCLVGPAETSLALLGLPRVHHLVATRPTPSPSSHLNSKRHTTEI
ncbi:hypothetical protein CEXT_245581 [Caerostris extrusa]|uniref:Uncharacterized protein n=1 Tax=Caerostris extrusa TaxID=172846 RepID=A0AAV4Q8Q3_CAEEX|nr:hypothetical protein CEXT_245581 [Caerostris extrusa]